MIPQGRVLDLPGRGRTFVVDVPGPTPDAPTIVLLHALGCTAYLSWVSALGELSRKYRVVTFDQRWHGRGIRSPRFRFADCADDVVGRPRRARHRPGRDRRLLDGRRDRPADLASAPRPGRRAGALLDREEPAGDTAREAVLPAAHRRHASRSPATRWPGWSAWPRPCRSCRRWTPSIPTAWGAVEFRSTSAWSFPEVLGELGRFNSAPWIGEVDVPTAVVVTEKDHTIPQRRQRRLAAGDRGRGGLHGAGGPRLAVPGRGELGPGVPRGRRRGGRPPRHLRGVAGSG